MNEWKTGDRIAVKVTQTTLPVMRGTVTRIAHGSVYFHYEDGIFAGVEGMIRLPRVAMPLPAPPVEQDGQ